jgi:hypothetical protein
MSGSADGETMAALLDAVTILQGQLEELGESNRRIEARQVEIEAQLDRISASQAAGPELTEMVGLMRRDRDATRSEIARVAQVAALTHAAALGFGAPLPSSVVDDELLELFILTQPADLRSAERAMVDWRRVAKSATAVELVDALARQYRAAPTDTPETRRLRYRLAAVTREELEGRGASLPPMPTSTFPTDISEAAHATRWSELARLWQAGESISLYGEPELAGALDIFAEAERQGRGLREEELASGLANLHRSIASRLAAGEHLVLAAHSSSEALDRAGSQPARTK